MGICPQELRHYVIRPTLQHLAEWSQAAENLLLGTAVQESEGGFHLKQKRCRGVGIYQITPNQHRAVWDQFLAHQPDLASCVRGLASQQEFLLHPDAELATNLAYATAIAWNIYKFEEAILPDSEDVKGLARCWYHHFHQRPTGSCRDFEKHYLEMTKNKELAA